MRRAAQAWFGTALIMLAAATASAQTVPDWDAVIAAAKREGQVVVYSTYMSPKTHQAVGEAFERKYGIRVELLQGRGEIRERVRIEQASGRYLGDVLHTAITVAIRARDENHSLQPLGLMPGLARLKPEFKRRADDFMAPIFTINYGILVNTRLVKPGDEPGGWQGLLDPKWKGKILADDPRASGGGRVMFHMTTTSLAAAFRRSLRPRSSRLRATTRNPCVGWRAGNIRSTCHSSCPRPQTCAGCR
jgi:iron(III) transport system substrate-binding protein